MVMVAKEILHLLMIVAEFTAGIKRPWGALAL